MTRGVGERHARWPVQVFRIAALVLPSALAWHVAFSEPHPTELEQAISSALAPLWVLTAAALVLRSLDALLQPNEATLLDRVDVLTASGSALSWLGAGATVASVWVGWASLSVVGVMALCLVHLTVVWTCVATFGRDPLRRASVSRRFIPEIAAEGKPVVEELRLSGVRIPVGFRLFASGRVGTRWPVSRYALDEGASGGDVVMENDLGPAVRGEHEAAPLELWLQDVLGLCRTARVRAGAARLMVLPRPCAVDGARALLGDGGSDLEPRPTRQLPTEGSFRLREYQPGDDARRIHWVRSMAARQIVTRLPDEIPPEQPSVALVLDTFFPGIERLCCDTSSELLDALVGVWLSVGRALVEAGVRVTLVGAVPSHEQGGAAPFRRRLTARSLGAAQRLGAGVRWQERVSVVGLLGDEPSIVVSCRLPAELTEGAGLRWVLVPVAVWTTPEQQPPASSYTLLPYPMGSAENRWSRRRRERLRFERVRRDEDRLFSLCWGGERGGSFIARPAGPSRVRLEALR